MKRLSTRFDPPKSNAITPAPVELYQTRTAKVLSYVAYGVLLVAMLALGAFMAWGRVR